MFGLVDTSTSPAKGLMWLVDATTLKPIIKESCLNGTVVWSDQWRTYIGVDRLPNINDHHTVYHSLNFVHPGTGTHTQNIESYWCSVS